MNRLDANKLIGNHNSVGLFSRRDMLQRMGAGFGTVALASMLDQQAEGAGANSASPLAPKTPHFPAKAKRVIQLFMPGGPSAVDTFDYKPDIARYAGQRPKECDLKSLRNTKGGLLKSPFGFKQYGQSGKWVSDIFPKTAEKVDDICFVHSMHTDIPEHAGGILMMNIGHVQPVRPSVGSWLLYGLGSENQNLPGFVSLCCDGAGPRCGETNWGTAFLPGAYAGCQVEMGRMTPEKALADLQNHRLSNRAQREQADLIAQLNRLHLKQREQDQNLEASIASMELAFRMQTAVPEAFDLKGETKMMHDLYGNRPFGKGCLLARRLVERGVRMVQVVGGNDIAWDSHGNINDHKGLAERVDQGIAALLTDLKQRGLLDETLVLWGGEFSRAPTAEGSKGRDHNHYGFTVFMAGGGVKPGFTYGATDRFGLRAVEDRAHVHDLHATIMHLLGLDHERVTYRHSGRDYRLTDIEGTVMKGVIA